MQLTIYRGTAEVGGTMIELKTASTRLLLDAGYPLFYRGEIIDDEWVKKPYQELLTLGVIPKITGLYRWDAAEFDAVLISHAHSDHFGMLKYIHPAIPVYLSEATDKLIEMSLGFPIPAYSARDRRFIRMYEPFSIGDFSITPYLMDHSAFQSAAFEIRCEGKTILYTGDFRGHGRRREYLERFLSEAPKVPDLLLIEGTTLGRRGEMQCSEDELTGKIKRTMEAGNGIVLCQPSAQNIDRIIGIYSAAKACGKIFIIDKYTESILSALRRLGYKGLPIPSFLRNDIRVLRPPAQSKKMNKLLGAGYVRRLCAYGVSVGMIARKQEQIVMLVRPSMLAELKQMNLKNGTLVYSQWQAYRDKPHQLRLEQYLKSRGFDDCYLHTSGHAFEEDIKKVITELSPKEIVPIHTFCPEAFYQFYSKVTLRRDGIPFSL